MLPGLTGSRSRNLTHGCRCKIIELALLHPGDEGGHLSAGVDQGRTVRMTSVPDGDLAIGQLGDLDAAAACIAGLALAPADAQLISRNTICDLQSELRWLVGVTVGGATTRPPAAAAIARTCILARFICTCR